MSEPTNAELMRALEALAARIEDVAKEIKQLRLGGNRHEDPPPARLHLQKDRHGHLWTTPGGGSTPGLYMGRPPADALITETGCPRVCLECEEARRKQSSTP